jgi:hypothetical protein
VVTPAETATYRTFDGQVIEFAGRRDGEKAFLTVTAHRDAKLAAKFPEPAAAAAPAAEPAAPDRASATPDAAKPADAKQVDAKQADQTVERLAARAKGVEYEIPAYKYEAIFKKHEELLEKRPEPARKEPAKK